MRKFFSTLLILLFLIGGGLYFGSSVFLAKMTDRILETVLQYGRTETFSVQQPRYNSVTLSGFDGIVWKGINFEALVTDPKGKDEKAQVTVWMDRIVLRALNLSEGLFKVTGTGIQASGGREAFSGEADGRVARLEEATFSGMLRLDVFSPNKAMAQLKALTQELKGFLENGRTGIPLQIEGAVFLPVEKQEVQVVVEMIQEGEQYMLILNKQSLRNLSKAMKEVLTEPEIELFSRNPLRAPRLFRIRDDAQETAAEALKADRTVPEDAYRHVLWSYLLTREFGAEFARTVTDAHEQGLTDNTEAEHRMDYNNNRVGREYAGQGVLRQDILSKVLSDPQVILSPRG